MRFCLSWCFFLCTFLTTDIARTSELALNIFQTFNSTKVRFLLWTRLNGDDHFQLLKNGDSEELHQSLFDGTKKTYFLFHGFNDNPTQDWILTSKTNILSVVDANIISVDYSELVVGPNINYPNAIRMIREVGQYTASFIDWLIAETPLTASRIHLIGHSLGAHTAGLTAKNVESGLIERVTGLDPAGPLFEIEIPDYRLDKSQAKLVDVIHTNACLFPLQVCRGIFKAIGHIDFYPNGGMIQAGCYEPLEALLYQCSHQRVLEFWNESILPSERKFQAYPCRNGWNFILGFCNTCNPVCVEMGFHLNASLEGTFYLSTRSVSPYAISR